MLTEKFVSVLPSLFGYRPKRKTFDLFEFCVLQKGKSLQVWPQRFDQTVSHCAGSRFAWRPPPVDLFQLFGIPDGIIHKGMKDIVHIRPVLVIGSQVFRLQAFCKLGPVFIPVKVSLQEDSA